VNLRSILNGEIIEDVADNDDVDDVDDVDDDDDDDEDDEVMKGSFFSDLDLPELVFVED